MSGACSTGIDGFIVNFPASGSNIVVECTFQKKTNIFQTATSSGLQHPTTNQPILFPITTYYFFPLDFTPDFPSSCADPENDDDCGGIINIPGSIHLLTVETTTPITHTSCDPNIVFSSQGIINSSSLYPIYRHIFVVQNSAIVSNSCHVTITKRGIQYTPYFFFLKQGEQIYSSDAIITNNIATQLDTDCQNPLVPTCTLLYTTPQLEQSDRDVFHVNIESSILTPYGSISFESTDATAKTSKYRQKTLKSFTPYHLPSNYVNNNPIYPVGSDAVVVSPSGKFFNQREYDVVTTSVKYLTPFEIEYDTNICADPTLPFCRMKIKTNYIGNSIVFRFTQLPFTSIIDRIQCNSEQMIIQNDIGDHCTIILSPPKSQKSFTTINNGDAGIKAPRIVSPANINPLSYDTTLGLSSDQIECWVDIALGYNESYPVDSDTEWKLEAFKVVPDVIATTLSTTATSGDNSINISINNIMWQDLPISYPYGLLTADVTFTTFPWSFSYGDDCATGSTAWCTLKLTLSESVVTPEKAKLQYLRPFTIAPWGLDLPINLMGDGSFINNKYVTDVIAFDREFSDHMQVQLTGSDFITTSFLIQPLEQTGDPNDPYYVQNPITGLVTINISTDFANSLIHYTDQFPYYNNDNLDLATPGGVKTIVLSIKYRTIPTKALPDAPIRVFSYNNVEASTPYTITTVNRVLINYNPPFTVSAGNDCSQVSNSFCTMTLQPDTTLVTTLTSITFKTPTSAILGPNIIHSDVFNACTTHNTIDDDDVLPDTLLFTCTINTSSYTSTTSPIPLLLNKRLADSATVITSTATTGTLRISSGNGEFGIVGFNLTPQQIQIALDPSSSTSLPMEEFQMNFLSIYTGDGKPTYGDDCSDQLNFQCTISFKFYTLPLYPDNTLLKYDVPFTTSTFDIIGDAVCTGVGLKYNNGDQVTSSDLSNIINIDLISITDSEYGSVTITTKQSTDVNLWSESKPITNDPTIVNGNYFECVVKSEKNLQKGQNVSGRVATIINGVNFAQDYPQFPSPTHAYTVYNSTPIRYRAITPFYSNACFVPQTTEVRCATGVYTYGSPRSPFKSIRGWVPFVDVQSNPIYSVFGNGVTLGAYYRMGIPLTSKSVFSEAKIIYDELGEGIGLRYISNLFLNTDWPPTPLSKPIGEYIIDLMFDAHYLGDRGFHASLIINEEYWYQPLTIYYWTYYPINEQIIQLYNLQLKTSAVISDLTPYPAYLNLQNGEVPSHLSPTPFPNPTPLPRKPLTLQLPPLAMGTMFTVRYGKRFTSDRDTLIQVRFTITTNGIGKVIADTLLTPIPLKCFQTDLNSSLNEPIVQENIVSGELLPDFKNGVTILNNLSKDTTDDSVSKMCCTATLTINKLYPSKSMYIDHTIVFNERNLQFHAVQSYPQYRINAQIELAEQLPTKK